jgi:hypothetical protein
MPLIRSQTMAARSKLRVHNLGAVYLSGSVVGIVRAPHAGSAVLNVIGNLDYQIGIVRGALSEPPRAADSGHDGQALTGDRAA